MEENSRGVPCTKTYMRRKSSSNRCCSVPGCSSRIQPGIISLHFFPKDPELRNEWKNRLKIKTPISNFMSICSLHFVTTDYLPSYPGIYKRPFLKRGSVPSQNLPPTPKQVAMMEAKRLWQLKRNWNVIERNNSKANKRRTVNKSVYKRSHLKKVSVPSENVTPTPHQKRLTPRQVEMIEARRLRLLKRNSNVIEHNNFEANRQTTLNKTSRGHVWQPVNTNANPEQIAIDVLLEWDVFT